MAEEFSDGDSNDYEGEIELEKEYDRLGSKKSRIHSLVEFRLMVEQAILGNNILIENENRKEITLWGVPLLPSASHPGTDAVLMKFLKAKHYKAVDAFKMLRKTLKWRADFQPERGFEETSRLDCDNLWFTGAMDKEGRPLCFNVLGKEFQRQLTNSDYGGKYDDYLRWRVWCVEKGIQNLRFGPGGADSFIQIFDLRNASGLAMEQVKLVSKKMMYLLRDHYPGIVYKNIIINAPWFLSLNALNLRVIKKRSRNKFIFVKPSGITRTLLKYATIENIPVEYGGLKCDSEVGFTLEDKVHEVDVRANSTEFIQIPINQVGVNLSWDLTFVGHEVTYREEFVPNDDCSYKILLQEKKLRESTRNSFYIREPGKILITIVNASYVKRKAFYRYKSMPFVPMYAFIN